MRENIPTEGEAGEKLQQREMLEGKQLETFIGGRAKVLLQPFQKITMTAEKQFSVLQISLYNIPPCGG